MTPRTKQIRPAAGGRSPMIPPLELARRAVSVRYGGALERLRWVPLGTAGGFSGASLWRGDDPAGRAVAALKAWPPGTAAAERLVDVHAWLKRAAHLPFVPVAFQTLDGSTQVFECGRTWEAASWMPGTADFHSNPTPARLANAAAAIAHLHRAWMPPVPTFAPCPAVRRRLDVLGRWEAVREEARSPSSLGHGGLELAIRRGIASLSRRSAEARRALLPWRDRAVAVQPCLCDVWHDHVLYEQDAVTGIIDFGAAKVDSLAVDLARLLGDFVGDDAARFDAALDAYRDSGGDAGVPDRFIHLLDRTGAVCAMAIWAIRLSVEARQFPDAAPVAARVAQLAARLESMPAIE